MRELRDEGADDDEEEDPHEPAPFAIASRVPDEAEVFDDEDKIATSTRRMRTIGRRNSVGRRVTVREPRNKKTKAVIAAGRIVGQSIATCRA